MELKGSPVSEGIVVGKAYLYLKEELKACKTQVSARGIEEEIAKLQEAFDKSRVEIEQIKEKAGLELGEEKAGIFGAHLSILNDPALFGEICQLIKTEAIDSASATETIIDKFALMYSRIPDEYIRERAADIKDVGSRIMKNILGIEFKNLSGLDEEVIIVAHDLTPSDTALLDRKYTLGFATDIGSTTSHTAILARSLGIPAVVGLGDVSSRVENGDTIILDGFTGSIITHPDADTVAQYRKRMSEYTRYKQELSQASGLPSVTPDGRHVEIFGNIGSVEDIDGVNAGGAEGVGLFRTEFLFLNRKTQPDEEEQFRVYRAAAERLNGKPLIIRTFDIGGDKKLPYLELPEEANPFLGWRAIRICLDKRDMFKTQLRAILRAGVYGDVKMMYPMISGIDEVRKANAILDEVKNELRSEKKNFKEDIETGVMIEIPSAAVTADIIAREVDFFSIGTNDLCQYCLAVDRMNPKISHIYQPLHPGVLRMIKGVIDAAHKLGKKTGMCGEMASDPLAAVILMGMGLDEFSMNASSIAAVKKVIRSITFQKAGEFAEYVLTLATAEEITAEARKLLDGTGFKSFGGD